MHPSRALGSVFSSPRLGRAGHLCGQANRRTFPGGSLGKDWGYGGGEGKELGGAERPEAVGRDERACGGLDGTHPASCPQLGGCLLLNQSKPRDLHR